MPIEECPRRIVPRLVANVSAVERTFSDAGFSYCTPVQRKVITERSKLTHTRPVFGLLPGYAFAGPLAAGSARADAWRDRCREEPRPSACGNSIAHRIAVTSRGED